MPANFAVVRELYLLSRSRY